MKCSALNVDFNGVRFRAVATGVYRYIYPQNQSTLHFFMWLFCLLDPGQIRVNIYTHPNQIPGYAPGKVWPPRFKESSVRAHQICIPPWKCAILLLSTYLAREWLQIDTDLLRIVTSTFRGYQHRWPWTTLNSKNMGFKSIFRYFRLWRTFRVNFAETYWR